jgi:DNA invertase Pin-like site-specific DNA recombinase
MVGVFAEFEREIIRERVIAGQARARATGVRFGRPTIPADKAAAIITGLKSGTGVVKLAKAHGVGVGTVERALSRLARRGSVAPSYRLPKPLNLFNPSPAVR